MPSGVPRRSSGVMRRSPVGWSSPAGSGSRHSSARLLRPPCTSPRVSCSRRSSCAGPTCPDCWWPDCSL
jgi:hypothetical protein